MEEATNSLIDSSRLSLSSSNLATLRPTFHLSSFTFALLGSSRWQILIIYQHQSMLVWSWNLFLLIVCLLWKLNTLSKLMQLHSSSNASTWNFSQVSHCAHLIDIHEHRPSPTLRCGSLQWSIQWRESLQAADLISAFIQPFAPIQPTRWQTLDWDNHLSAWSTLLLMPDKFHHLFLSLSLLFAGHRREYI